jgi:hypothetical protein
MKEQPAEGIPLFNPEGTDVPKESLFHPSGRGKRKTLADRGRYGKTRKGRKGRS